MDKNKIAVFVPIGETRCPKKGEWYFDDDIFITASYDHVGEKSCPILGHIEIEIPKEARNFNYYFANEDFGDCSLSIPLTHPKVKKWKWQRDFGDECYIRTKKHLTYNELMELEDGIKACTDWHKVEGSEVEE